MQCPERGAAPPAKPPPSGRALRGPVPPPLPLATTPTERLGLAQSTRLNPAHTHERLGLCGSPQRTSERPGVGRAPDALADGAAAGHVTTTWPPPGPLGPSNMWSNMWSNMCSNVSVRSQKLKRRAQKALGTPKARLFSRAHRVGNGSMNGHHSTAILPPVNPTGMASCHWVGPHLSPQPSTLI